MEASGEVFINKMPGIRGPEGIQVSSVHLRTISGPVDITLSCILYFFIFMLDILVKFGEEKTQRETD